MFQFAIGTLMDDYLGKYKKLLFCVCCCSRMALWQNAAAAGFVTDGRAIKVLECHSIIFGKGIDGVPCTTACQLMVMVSLELRQNMGQWGGWGQLTRYSLKVL